VSDKAYSGLQFEIFKDIEHALKSSSRQKNKNRYGFEMIEFRAWRRVRVPIIKIKHLRLGVECDLQLQPELPPIIFTDKFIREELDDEQPWLRRCCR
jgi:hypothetical protein